jgi:hypothetical protein
MGGAPSYPLWQDHISFLGAPLSRRHAELAQILKRAYPAPEKV